jgi:glycosyltransferase involved in cell wall biosynthesis
MKKILFLGTNNFPYGMAEVSKQILIARALQEEGCDVTFVCTRCYSDLNIPIKGVHQNIRYIYTNLFTRKLKNKILNRLFWILGSVLEVLYLFVAKYDFVIVNSRDYATLHKYSQIVHFRKKKIFLTHSEDKRSMCPNPDKKTLKQIEDFENKTWDLLDGFFPISEELLIQVKNKKVDLPYLKIPVLVDIQEAIAEKNKERGKYFMFAGAADYITTINFIISGFEKTSSNTTLTLVISGHKKNLESVKERIINSQKRDKIILKSYIPKSELWQLYSNASALVIPLNFDQRDKARFPHKLGEYCANKVPIITSEWGEIPYYFESYKNAILLKSNDPEELGNAFEFVLTRPKLCEEIAEQAYQLALNEFNYQNYGNKILSFMKCNQYWKQNSCPIT